MSSAQYSHRRVAYLLLLSHRDAIGEDERFVSCLANCTHDGPGASTTHAEFDPVFTIAEWNDVHGARDRVVARGRLAEQDLALQLELQGHTTREVAELLKRSHVSVWRQSRKLIELIVDELGGEAPLAGPTTSQVPACLSCGTRPRVRLRARYRHKRGLGRVETRAERQASVCRECLTPKLLDEVLETPAWRAA